jgi:hypothetical protein
MHRKYFSLVRRQTRMAVLGCAILTGCVHPFSSREPEPPEQNSSNFIPATTAEIVFVNLEFAIRDKNVENYIRSFVDTTLSERSFTFIPDQGVAGRNPRTFDNWGIEDERRYITQLFQATPDDSTRGLLLAEDDNNPGPNTATFVQSYELVVRHTNRSESAPVIVRGEARFLLEKNETGDWAIYRWEDISNGTDPTWSDLKAFFQ